MSVIAHDVLNTTHGACPKSHKLAAVTRSSAFEQRMTL